MKTSVAVLCLFLVSNALADEKSETLRLKNKYQARYDVALPDGSRCDLVNAKYAIEVDWADKWQEAIGQSLLYAIWTDRKPAVLILVKNTHEEKHFLLRCKLVCERAGIKMFVEKAKGAKPAGATPQAEKTRSDPLRP